MDDCFSRLQAGWLLMLHEIKFCRSIFNICYSAIQQELCLGTAGPFRWELVVQVGFLLVTLAGWFLITESS